MAEMLHEIEIDAPPERIFHALTTEAGLKSWWTADAVAKPEAGAVAEFGFNNRAVVFRMRIQELQRPRRVLWECMGDVDEWKGTNLLWQMEPTETGTKVKFQHAGWLSDGGMFAMCNSTWGALMWRLKEYAEGRSQTPLFA